MSFPFSPYLSQILMELLKFFISLQRIKISIYVRKVREVIWYGKLYNKRLVATGLDRFFLRCGPIRTGLKRSGYGPLISGSVYTGCGCQLPRFEAKNRTGLDFKTLVVSAWKSSPKTGKRPRLDWTKTAKDQKFPGLSKTATTVRSGLRSLTILEILRLTKDLSNRSQLVLVTKHKHNTNTTFLLLPPPSPSPALHHERP
jgi:hypothetical protein